ncbi:hypothetical protein CCACVL1_19784 [Corchorus capsularis]|uniref:Uncharacterized protein n=1 Tax=Corchorus capsularis TaxID=210143 RepID=A0A1R3HEY6_COCAP|nr:hypothetical protein CCACVL1_19784 [Corchorus capsularis]
MPQELPGFYYDAEKNRYFPIKPRIPGSSSNASQSQKNPLSNSIDPEATKLYPNTGASVSRLLCLRELNGNAFTFDRGRHSFEEEFHKLQASKPVVWRYRDTVNMTNSALEQAQISVQTPEGETETDVLLAGSIDGSLSFLKVGKFGVHSDYGVIYVPDHVWPSGRPKSNEKPGHIWMHPSTSLEMSSRISCIRLPEKRPFFTNDDDFRVRQALITTLGSETAGGCVYILNLLEPVDLGPVAAHSQRLHAVASFNHTIWTSDYNPHTSRAVIGTNLGAALINVERGTSTWVCRSKSDVLAQQFDQTGNLVLCGFRNGAVVTIDVRENQERNSARLTRHRIPYFSSGRNKQKQWFELKGHICPSHTIYMPSSISSLVSLQSYDQYFLASSMDGSMKLYDHRLTKRGAVQSYGGHVNSHTRIKLGVDQSERFVMSGGEDCFLRLWSVKSGKLLFEEKFSDSVLTSVSWRRAKRCLRREDERPRYEEHPFECYNSCEAWLASQEGIFQMQWS